MLGDGGKAWYAGVCSCFKFTFFVGFVASNVARSTPRRFALLKRDSRSARFARGMSAWAHVFLWFCLHLRKSFAHSPYFVTQKNAHPSYMLRNMIPAYSSVTTYEALGRSNNCRLQICFLFSFLLFLCPIGCPKIWKFSQLIFLDVSKRFWVLWSFWISKPL